MSYRITEFFDLENVFFLSIVECESYLDSFSAFEHYRQTCFPLIKEICKMMDPDHLYTNNDNLTFYYNILIHLLEKCKESNKENDDADTKKRVLEELKATRTRLREIEMIKERLRRIRKSAKRLKRNKRFLKEKKAIKKKENVERLRANLFEKNK